MAPISPQVNAQARPCSPGDPTLGYRDQHPPCSLHTVCQTSGSGYVIEKSRNIPTSSRKRDPGLTPKSSTFKRYKRDNSTVSLDPSNIPTATTATESPLISLKFLRPPLLPPRLPVQKSPEQVHRVSTMPRTEIIFIICVVGFGLLVALVAVIVGRTVWKKLGTDRLVLPNLCFRKRQPKYKMGGEPEATIKSILLSSKLLPGGQTVSTPDPSQCDESKEIQTKCSLYDDNVTSSTLRDKAAVDSQSSLKMMQEEFEERCHEEETDIALALQFALREQLPPVIIDDGPTSPLITSFDIDDMFARLSLRAGIESVGKRTGLVRNRPTQDSGYDCGDLSSTDSSETVSSNESDDSEDDRDNDRTDLAELRMAQTRSIEVKKGMLISWRSCDSLAKAEREISKMPTVVVSGASPVIHRLSFPGPLSSSSSSLNGLLHPPLPSLIITSPSLKSLASIPSSTSSISVDLNDFPTPPFQSGAAVVPISTEIDGSPLFRAHDLDAWDVNNVKPSSGQNRRSTLAQLLMMYTVA